MSEQEERSAVVAEGLTWLHTPYHSHARIKGVGVDCAQILADVFPAALGWPRIELEDYPRDWHLHRSEERYERLLAHYGARRLPDGARPQQADIATFKWGRTFSHGGIFVDHETVLHAYIGAEVMLTRLTEAPLAGREMHLWSHW